MKPMVLGLCAPILSSAVFLARAPSQAFNYVGWGLSDNRIAIDQPVGEEAEGIISMGNDGMAKTRFCSLKSQYVCFESAHYAFLVPSTPNFDGGTFEHNGIRSHLRKGRLKVTILGKSVDDVVMVRSSGEHTPENKYLFSWRVGLIAIRMERDWEGGTVQETYWLEGEMGFGARR
jgi:hypothetical protein